MILYINNFDFLCMTLLTRSTLGYGVWRQAWTVMVFTGTNQWHIENWLLTTTMTICALNALHLQMPKSLNESGVFTYIDKPEQLDKLMDDLMNVTELAIDLEVRTRGLPTKGCYFTVSVSWWYIAVDTLFQVILSVCPSKFTVFSMIFVKGRTAITYLTKLCYS